jgi:hypothetical protein
MSFENSDLGALVFRWDAEDHILGLSVFDGRIRNMAWTWQAPGVQGIEACPLLCTLIPR